MTTPRRTFLKVSSTALIGSAFPSRLAFAAEIKSPVRYLTASSVSSPHTSMSSVQRRESFGWKVAGIPGTSENSSLEIRWKNTPAPGTDCSFRIALMDTSEMQNLVEVSLIGSGKVIGQFDIRKASTFQPSELRLPKEDAAAAIKEGIRLRQTLGEVVLWVVTGVSDGEQPTPKELTPHLLPLVKTDPVAEYFNRMETLATVGYFGWCEGCTLDGLLQLSLLPGKQHYRKTLEQHLSLFFKKDGRFIYENPRGKANDNRIGGIESMLPWAPLAVVDPKHPSFGPLEAKWASMEKNDAEGCIIDGKTTTSEGAYTVGYPMAILAKQRGDKALAERAVVQLLVRQKRFFDGVAFTRVAKTQPDGTIIPGDNRNWCRGITWQILGMARVIETLDGFIDMTEAKKEYVRLVEWLTPYQLDNGLWSVFVDEKQLTADAGGSAGIAAAIAIGVKHGWLPSSHRATAEKAWKGLVANLTPDGLLKGTSQSNWGGEGLQRSDYRVIYQMSMGLMAQLHAALQ